MANIGKNTFFYFSIILVIITLYNQDNPDMKHLSLRLRLANTPVAFIAYLEKTFWPHDLAIFYPFPVQIPIWQVIGASLLIIFISTAVILTAKRFPYLLVGWLWFSITIAPVSGIIQISIMHMRWPIATIICLLSALLLCWLGVFRFYFREKTFAKRFYSRQQWTF